MSSDIGERIRQSSPRKLSDAEQREIIAAAVLAGRTRHRSLAMRRFATGGAVLAAAAALLLVARSVLPLAPAQDMTRLALASGDRLTAVQDTDFDVLSDDPEGRRVNLHRGAMLFDIAHLESGEHFRVETPGTNIEVVGTIFSVEVSERGTSVVVFEEHVEVEEDGHGSVLRAGQRYREDRASRRSEPLDAVGRRAAEERAMLASAESAPIRATPAAAADGVAESEVVEPASLGTEVSEASGAPTSELDDAAGSSGLQQDELGDSPSADPLDRVAQTTSRAAAQRRRRAMRRSARAIEERSSSRESPVSPSETAPSSSAPSAELSDSRGDDDPVQRFEREAREYDHAAGRLSGARRAEAGTRAALIYWRQLHRASAALASLVASDALESENPLRERALAIQAEALISLGRHVPGELAARRYLEEFPEGPRAIWMRVRLRRRASSHIVPLAE